MERPFSSVASFQALSCCECAGGAVSATRASATSGNATLIGSPSKKSTGSRKPGCKNFSAGPRTALGTSTCSKVSGFMNVHVSPAANTNSMVCRSSSNSSRRSEGGSAAPTCGHFSHCSAGSDHSAQLGGSGLRFYFENFVDLSLDADDHSFFQCSCGHHKNLSQKGAILNPNQPFCSDRNHRRIA